MKQMVPNKTQMRAYLRRKLTQQQIVEAWEEDSGIRVSRSAIAMAISRYDLKASHARPRYEDTLPWKVKAEHQNDHNARMLRLEGRRRRSMKLTDQEAKWLADWKRLLREQDAVVTYHPDHPGGFLWVARNQWDDDEVVRKDWDNRPDGSNRKKSA